MYRAKSLVSASVLVLLVLLITASSCSRKGVPQKSGKAKSNQFTEDLSAFRPQYKAEETDEKAPVKSAAAQKNVTPTHDVTAKLDTIMSSIAEQNKNIRYAQGYRIQIYSGNNREEASKARDRSYNLFPHITPHIIYNQPTFRVKVGDFVDRLEAQNVYAGLMTEFPNAMIVQDRIEIK